jgi:hypothetical protein
MAPAIWMRASDGCGVRGRQDRSVERDGDEARAQQHKTGRGYREKSIGNEIVMVTHDAPAIFPMIARFY